MKKLLNLNVMAVLTFALLGGSGIAQSSETISEAGIDRVIELNKDTIEAAGIDTDSQEARDKVEQMANTLKSISSNQSKLSDSNFFSNGTEVALMSCESCLSQYHLELTACQTVLIPPLNALCVAIAGHNYNVCLDQNGCR